MDILALATGNLLQPAVLFFVLGMLAGFAKSDLSIPEGVVKTMALYLMLCIGFKGGVEAAKAGLTPDFLVSALTALILSFGLPVVAFGILSLFPKLDRSTRAATAAHYGSVSAVTFAAASEYLRGQGVPYAAYMAAIVAVMETPAIVSGLMLAGRGGNREQRAPMGEVLREVLLNGTVVLLLGAFVIGAITGDRGLAKIDVFVNPLFQGILCLFLLEMGLVAVRRLMSANKLTPGMVVFGIAMPLISMSAALGLCALLGVPHGNWAMMAILAASASYIAVPAAMSLALPRADAGVYLPLSLGVTFPFNIIVGIPLYLWIAQRLA
ncbi:sodium-dependent bicarbonate transport family permease [Phenylobacterium sp.]|jgi:hypothetical protein|uniref:sodium-dependent bicarbonate transport family permease n=1 Tax=Phenylobacterium sp. TaxID=1871053 RepID=UPI0037C98624